MPEMGMSMMLNASYGKSFYKKHAAGRNLKITPDQAQSYAQTFIDNNALGYILGIPETYPGYLPSSIQPQMEEGLVWTLWSMDIMDPSGWTHGSACL